MNKRTYLYDGHRITFTKGSALNDGTRIPAIHFFSSAMQIDCVGCFEESSIPGKDELPELMELIKLWNEDECLNPCRCAFVAG